MKSCVGSTWCRYGVQDSVSHGRRPGAAVPGPALRRTRSSPASRGARASARRRSSKDFGVIATENGWNLYVGGNGGFTPRHAQLLLQDIDTATLLRTIDRFLMFYIRTADRLQRTAPWIEAMAGGLDHLRAVRAGGGLARHRRGARRRRWPATSSNYRDEWAGVLEPIPEKRARFVSFVNAPGRARPRWCEFDEERVPARCPLLLGMPASAGATVVTALDVCRPGRPPARWPAWCRAGAWRCCFPTAHQVAVFLLTFDGDAAGHRTTVDPFAATERRCSARGLVGDRAGASPTVASPLLKQVFDLSTGICVTDGSKRVAVHDVRVRDGVVEVRLRRADAS